MNQINQDPVRISSILPKILGNVQRDLHFYNIKTDSKDHLRLLYHHTITTILDNRKINSKIYYYIDDTILNLLINTPKKYTTFLYRLHNILPTIVIKEACLDPIFNKIIMNRIKKSTKKNTNIYKLIKFSKKYKLNELLDLYLSDPAYRYAIQ